MNGWMDRCIDGLIHKKACTDSTILLKAIFNSLNPIKSKT
jgi:hypothetical protein